MAYFRTQFWGHKNCFWEKSKDAPVRVELQEANKKRIFQIGLL